MRGSKVVWSWSMCGLERGRSSFSSRPPFFKKGKVRLFVQFRRRGSNFRFGGTLSEAKQGIQGRFTGGQSRLHVSYSYGAAEGSKTPRRLLSYS